MQICEKMQLQPANINERKVPHSVACNSSISAAAGCVEIPESSAAHGYQRHETPDSNDTCHRDVSAASAVSVTDNSKHSMTHEEALIESKPLG
jgi:hypothetical protein